MRLPTDFKGPRKVPNYTTDQPPEAWVESYEMAMEMLDVDEASCAKYFTMMLEGTARTWLKNLPANSVESWDQLKARFIANFKDTCKQPMSIVDLDVCVQGENEPITHWVRRVSKVLHSLDRINAGQAIITLERNCRFKSLKMKLGRLKRHYNDMGTLMEALVKYADSDNTKDPNSGEEKPEKGKKNGGAKGQHHNQGGHGNNGKRKANSLDLVANTNMQHRKAKPPQHGGGMNLERLINQPCPKHGTKEAPATHLWKDCYIMKEFKNSDLFRYEKGPSGGSGPGFHGGGGSNSGFQNN